MIFPEVALRARCLADGGIRTFLGERFYPFHAPQNAPRPYVTYRRISGNPERHMGGASPLANARIQFDIVADTWDAAARIADKFRMVLDGFRGPIEVGAETFHVRQLALENSIDESVPPPAGNDEAIYRIMQDYVIDYTIPKPPFTKEPT